MVSNNFLALLVQKDNKVENTDVSKGKSVTNDQEKIAELEVNLNNWVDTV